MQKHVVCPVLNLGSCLLNHRGFILMIPRTDPTLPSIHVGIRTQNCEFKATGFFSVFYGLRSWISSLVCLPPSRGQISGLFFGLASYRAAKERKNITRLTLSQILSFKECCSTFLNHTKLADLLILRR